jgi:site-specific recombinase XerD
MVEADLDAALLYTAHDAGIENADEVTPLSLRHTYVAFLVRQGIRFSELVKLIGHLPAATLAAYKLLTTAGPRQPLERVDRLLPAIRELSAG